MEKLTKTTNKLADKDHSIFGEDSQIGIGDHNVHEIFPAGSPELINAIQTHYGQRCGHLPDTPSVAIMVGNITPAVKKQIDYYSNLLGKPIAIETRATLNGQYNGALVVPYINTSIAETRLRAHGLNIWGLPGKMVDALKNKATSHLLIQNLAIPGFQTPDFRIFEVDSLVEKVNNYLQEITQLYEETEMRDYPVGVMIRAAESDGNYGACYITQEEKKLVKFMPNGLAEESIYLTSWSQALNKAQTHLYQTASSNKQAENRIVVSRLMELYDSPGMSALILNGHITSLGWNGQIRKNGSSACIGTSSYNPTAPELKKIQAAAQDRTTEAFFSFLKQASYKLGVDLNTVRGFVNVDLMIPGKRELEFQRRFRDNTTLKTEQEITVAELNPRFTNFTDALLLVAGVTGQAKTIHTLEKIIEDGILTIDKCVLPQSVDINEAVETIELANNSLNSQGTRIVIRMRDNPMGLVLTGNTNAGLKRLSEMGYSYL